MTKPTTAKDPVEILDLSLRTFFPFDLSSEEQDGTEKVNQAYRKLFEELIPGFEQKHVQFVLAEVLEIDRKESASRLAVYSDLGGGKRDNLIKEYKQILESLKDVSPVLISESDAFYLTSRIWCAETRGAASARDKSEKEWSFRRESITTTGVDLKTNFDLQKEEQEIERTFRVYVGKLHKQYLKNYPFAYVLLVPIFLNSMSSREETLKKLGAVFLHFTTTQRVDHIDLRRIYSRTLLFWHYFFTSEAIEKRQIQLQEQKLQLQEQEARASVYTKIEPYLNEVRRGLLDIRQPLRRLEAELNPVKGLLFGGEDVSSEFFSASGRIVKLRDGLPEIFPEHDWRDDGDVEGFKKIVAGVLIKVLHLEKKIPRGKDLWGSVSVILGSSPQPVFRELLRSLPALENRSPSQQEVKDTFCELKSWFSDSYKRETSAGLSLNFVEFALRVLDSEVEIKEKELSSFWVASRHPVQTIDALGMINAMCGIKRATISVTGTRSDVSNARLSCCGLTLDLSPTSKKAGTLSALSRSLSKTIKEDEDPRGDMTRFLWMLSGRRELSLRGTRFMGSDKRRESEITIDFMQRRGSPRKLLITWRGIVEI